MFKKLRISLIFSNLVAIRTLNSNHRMHNLYANFVRILEVCKQYSQDLVNDKGDMPRCDVVPKFSDLEVIALNLTPRVLYFNCFIIFSYGGRSSGVGCCRTRPTGRCRGTCRPGGRGRGNAW